MGESAAPRTGSWHPVGMEPLRLGVLGAARISPPAIIDPAHATGTPLIAVAARDPQRAREFASEHGIQQVLANYGAVVTSPDVDTIYNPLPNGLHGPWNLAAIAAGKHVLSEKPFASNLEEAIEVRDAAAAAGVCVGEAFHYWYHPLMQRVLDLVGSGALGDIESVDADMQIPPPSDSDPRWSFALAGGALMDVGCYSLHAHRALGALLGGEPSVVAARAGERRQDPGVDEWLDIDLAFPSGATGSARCSMVATGVHMPLRVTGTKGSLYAHNFVLPQLDDQLEVTIDGNTTTYQMGTRSTYTYQLEAFTSWVREGKAFATDADDAVLQAGLIDDGYRAAGLPPRPRSAKVNR